ncbi:MAG: extracellular solute-binding protein family 1, partial [Acidimicrobiaceae bacterium]|nr:extracellular solute-binding protein family 1 [Acidimicrobiaceae bacterium]
MQVRTRRTLRASAALLAGAAGAAMVGGLASASPKATNSGHITLTYWNGFTGPDGPTVKALVSQFNKTHPNITINMSIMPWDTFYTKLLPALASGSGPDFVAMDTQKLPQYANKGVFVSLNSYFQKSPNTSV